VTERLLRVCHVETNPWTYVPTEDAGTDEVLDYDLSPYARHVIEGAEPGALHCRGCENPVGLVEVTTEDTYGRESEHLEWRYLTVVSDNAEPRFDKAWVLCEDCSGMLGG
jgi:hypothetical protein